MFDTTQLTCSILIVDDTPSNLHLLYESVKGLGEIYFATDGASAIEKAKQHTNGQRIKFETHC